MSEAKAIIAESIIENFEAVSSYVARQSLRDMVDENQALRDEKARLRAEYVKLFRLAEPIAKMLTELTILPIGCSREQELAWKMAVKNFRHYQRDYATDVLLQAALTPQGGGGRGVMSKYRKQDIETLLRLQLGEAEKAKINAQQAVERLERERTCAETYLPIIADKLQFSSSQFSKLSSGWCEELANAIADLQAQSKEACREAQQQVAQLREKVAHYDRWLAKGVYFTTEEYAERVKQFDTLHTAHTTLRGLVEQANYELAALFPVPDSPTFENAFAVCGNKNTADARCILNAYEAIHEAASLPAQGGV